MMLWRLLLHAFNKKEWAERPYLRHLWQAFLILCLVFLVVKYFGLLRSIGDHATFMESVRIVGIVIWTPLFLWGCVAILSAKGESILGRFELLFLASLATHALPMAVLKRMDANVYWWPAIIGLVALFVGLYGAVVAALTSKEAPTPQVIHAAPKALRVIEAILASHVGRSDRRGMLLRVALLAAGCWTLYSNALLVGNFSQSLAGMDRGAAAAHTLQITLDFVYAAGFGIMLVFWINSWTQGPEDGFAMSVFPVIVMFGTPLLIQLVGVVTLLGEAVSYFICWSIVSLIGLVASGWSGQALISLAAWDGRFETVMEQVGNSGVLSMIAPWRISFAGWLVLVFSWLDAQKKAMPVSD
jgi:hypothetical protein